MGDADMVMVMVISTCRNSVNPFWNMPMTMAVAKNRPGTRVHAI